MGKTFDVIGSGLSKLGGGMKDVFSNSGDVVGQVGEKGTDSGLTMGDLKGAGWTPDDMKSMGLEGKPSTGTRIARGVARGSLGAVSGAMGSQNQQRTPGGAPVQFDASSPTLPADFFNPNDPYAKYRNQGVVDPTAFYGR